VVVVRGIACAKGQGAEDNACALMRVAPLRQLCASLHWGPVGSSTTRIDLPWDVIADGVQPREWGLPPAFAGALRGRPRPA